MLRWSSAEAAFASRTNRARGGVARQLGGKKLERYMPVEFGVVGAVHVPHAAGTQMSGDLVTPDLDSWIQAPDLGVLR